MLMKLNMKKAGQSVASAALLCVLAFSAGSIPEVAAQDATGAQLVSFSSSVTPAAAETGEVQAALENFIHGMAAGDQQTVWAYASEEDQAAFETEAALYTAFAQDFPELTQATDVRVQSVRNEGDTPFVKLTLRDADGNAYVADVGFWLDDAGDWKVVSCDIVPASDRVAAL